MFKYLSIYRAKICFQRVQTLIVCSIIVQLTLEKFHKTLTGNVELCFELSNLYLLMHVSNKLASQKSNQINLEILKIGTKNGLLKVFCGINLNKINIKWVQHIELFLHLLVFIQYNDIVYKQNSSFTHPFYFNKSVPRNLLHRPDMLYIINYICQ